MKLGIAQFRSLLVVSCLSFAVENLMDLTDMAIAGNLLGATALAGVEETLMETYERNGGKRVRAEVTLDRSTAPIRIILRDDGDPPARSGETAVAPDSIRRHVLGRVSKSLSKVRDLTAIGINRHEFSI